MRVRLWIDPVLSPPVFKGHFYAKIINNYIHKKLMCNKLGKFAQGVPHICVFIRQHFDFMTSM